MAVSGIHRALFNGATTKGGDCGGRHGYAPGIPPPRGFYFSLTVSFSFYLSLSLLLSLAQIFISVAYTARE